MNINWLTLLLLLSLGFTVVGCGEAPMTAEEKAYQAKLIGTWVHEERPDVYFSFEEEKASLGGPEIDYRIKGETIHFRAPNEKTFTATAVLTPEGKPNQGTFTFNLPNGKSETITVARHALGTYNPPLRPFQEDPNAIPKRVK